MSVDTEFTGLTPENSTEHIGVIDKVLGNGQKSTNKFGVLGKLFNTNNPFKDIIDTASSANVFSSVKNDSSEISVTDAYVNKYITEQQMASKGAPQDILGGITGMNTGTRNIISWGILAWAIIATFLAIVFAIGFLIWVIIGLVYYTTLNAQNHP